METVSSVLAGIPSVHDWSGVYTQEVSLGRLVCCISLNGDAAPELGKKKIEEFRLFSQSDVSKEGFVAFFQQFVVPSMQIAAGLITDNESLFCASFGGRVELVREHESHTIVQSQSSESNINFMRGQVVAGDYIALGTQEFFATVFTDLVASIDPVEKVSELASQTQYIEKAAAAGVVVGIDIPPKEKIPLPIEHVPVVAPVTLPSKPFKRPTLHLSKRSIAFSPRFYKLAILIAVIAALVFGIMGLQKIVLSKRQGKVDALLAPYKKRFDEASTQSDRVQKIQSLRALITDLDTLESQQKNDVNASRAISALEDKARDVYEQSSSEKSIQKLQIFYDFRLVAADFIGTSVGFDKPGKLAVFLDAAHNRVLSLSVENKAAQTLSVDEKLQGPVSLAVDNRKAYVLGKTGILELSLPLDQMGKIIVNPDGDWKSPQSLGVFGNNLYVLDPERRGLIRFDATDPTASGSAWLRNKEGIEFDELHSLSIDGEVWMTTEKGKVLRFARGEQVNFTLNDAIGLPTSTIALYTNQDSQNLYLIEPRAKRILIYTKSGDYVSSVVSDDLETASSLIVDEDTKTAYVLAGSLVYSVKLE